VLYAAFAEVMRDSAPATTLNRPRLALLA
jgi:hypothetical protein